MLPLQQQPPPQMVTVAWRADLLEFTGGDSASHKLILVIYYTFEYFILLHVRVIYFNICDTLFYKPEKNVSVLIYFSTFFGVDVI